MAGTWPTARAAIVAQINGLSHDLGADFASKTLTAREFAFAGRQDASNFPYAFIMPAELRVTRHAGMQRATEVDAVVRVMLAPSSYAGNMEVLHRLYDGWVATLTDALDDGVALDGTADVFLDQSFSGLSNYDDLDEGWGFEMTLGGIRITEIKTFGA